MIVVDIGCATHARKPGEESILALCERFGPAWLYGFDPHPALVEETYKVGGTTVETRRLAAWTHDGLVTYSPSDFRPWSSQIAPSGVPAACFDLAAWLTGPLSQDRVILKLDAEGSEFPLLRHLHEQGVDEYLDLILVEWHASKALSESHSSRRRLVRDLRCEVQEW